MCGGKKKKRKKMINNGTLIRSKAIAANGFGLGEVAFVRWLVCRKAILPNPCYTLGRLFSRNLISSTNKKNKK
jgi:hypothetical protein